MRLGSPRVRRGAFGLAVLACALAAASGAPLVTADSQTRPEPPRLVVLLVVDQFRADYSETYGHQWKHGLRRIFDRGAVFRRAAYPYAGSLTCPGHSTIGTGTLPFVHGMISNSWYDRSARRTALCSADPQATAVTFGGGRGVERHGPMSLMVPTFSDELRRQAKRQPKIVALSLKPRSSIGLGGHGGPGTMVIWEEDNGTWSTSDRYTENGLAGSGSVRRRESDRERCTDRPGRDSCLNRRISMQTTRLERTRRSPGIARFPTTSRVRRASRTTCS